ncbi:MAG: hypothetical protein J0L61_01665 [Planctomycetes bacterium]|nr:hypothetical protein [Planctomycetota bacterium]
MNDRFPFRFGATAAVACCVVGAGHAGAQHIGDILVEPVNNVITTSGIVAGPGGPEFVSGLRVFMATFGEFPNFTDDPGFDTTGGVGFPNGVIFAFDLLDSLRVWNGVDFDALPPETVRVSKGSTSVTTPLTPNQVAAGFAFGQVGSGFLHEHLRYFLNVPQGAGVYAMQVRLRVTNATYQPSPPFWIVFNQNSTAGSHAAAAAYLQNLVAPACPGDLSGDGVVNTADLAALLGSFGESVLRYSNGDFNGDTVVSTPDLAAFLGRFGSACR